MAASKSVSSRWLWLALGSLGATSVVCIALYLSRKRDDEDEPDDSNRVVVEDVGNEEQEMSPLERAMASKNRGNKYFKAGQYEVAISKYSDAIELCPQDKRQELATFHQNRAAAFDQLKRDEEAYEDCCAALRLNTKYQKALERRAKVSQRLASATEDFEKTMKLLREALEDMTAVCILEAFQNNDHLMSIDAILKQLGKRGAKRTIEKRQPMLMSNNFIRQYFESFSEDPVNKDFSGDEKSGDNEEDEGIGNGETKDDEQLEEARGYEAALREFRNGQYSNIIESCKSEPEDSSNYSASQLLHASFLILSQCPKEAFALLSNIIESDRASPKIKVNALIKRASLIIQRCEDPKNDAELSLADFKKAIELDVNNSDIYHHRGQVHLLLDDMSKAVADFEKAVELQPNFAVACVQKLYTDYRVASNSGDADKIAEALKKLEGAVERFPNCIESYALCAQGLCDRQEFEKADALYEKAIKVDPTNANLLVHRGLILLQWKGDVSGAANFIEKAIALDSKCEFAHETLGTIEVQRGNLPRAIEVFDKAIALANTEIEMAHLIGLKEAAMGQLSVTSRLGVAVPGMMAK